MQITMGSLSPGDVRAIAICTVFFIAGLVVVIMALLEHQHRMAKILRADRQQGEGLDARVDELQSEIRELKSLLQRQAQPAASEDLKQRIVS